jgi:hypothetical protein
MHCVSDATRNVLELAFRSRARFFGQSVLFLIRSGAWPAAEVLERTGIKFAVHEERDMNLLGQRCRTGLLQQ